MTGDFEADIREEDYYPDDADARSSTERLFHSALAFLNDHQARYAPQLVSRICDPMIQDQVKEQLFDCHYLYPAYERAKFHYEDRMFAQLAGLLSLKPVNCCSTWIPFRVK